MDSAKKDIIFSIPHKKDKQTSLGMLNDPRFRITPYQQMTSAVTGALITSLTMTPLDVVKTRLQAQQKSLLSNKCFLYCNGLMEHLCPCGPNMNQFNSQKTIHFNGTVDAIIKISRYEGVGALWSGLGPTLILALPATVIYFVAYEQFKIRYKHLYYDYIVGKKNYDSIYTAPMPFYTPLFAGATARIFSVTVVCPLEMIRTKMQSQKLNYFELLQALKILVGNEGVLGLWKGLSSTLYRDVPFSAIYWTCYEQMKKSFSVVDPTFGFSFMAGAISGSIAAFITTPFDVIKTHQQIEVGEKVIYTDKPSKLILGNTFKRMKEIYTVHGIKGLYTGIMPRLAKVAPACAIMISTFEYSKHFFYKYNYKKFNSQFDLKNNELSYQSITNDANVPDVDSKHTKKTL